MTGDRSFAKIRPDTFAAVRAVIANMENDLDEPGRIIDTQTGTP